MKKLIRIPYNGWSVNSPFNEHISVKEVDLGYFVYANGEESPVSDIRYRGEDCDRELGISIRAIKDKAKHLLMKPSAVKYPMFALEYDYRGKHYRIPFAKSGWTVDLWSAYIDLAGNLHFVERPFSEPLVDASDLNVGDRFIEIDIEIPDGWVESDMAGFTHIVSNKGITSHISNNHIEEGVYIAYGGKIHYSPSYRLTNKETIQAERLERIKSECGDWFEVEYTSSHNTNATGSNCLVVDGQMVSLGVHDLSSSCDRIIVLEASCGGSGRYYSERFMLLVEPDLYYLLFEDGGDDMNFQSYTETWASEVVRPTPGATLADFFKVSNQKKKKK